MILADGAHDRLGDGFDVRATLAERRHMYAEDVQAVVEVVTQALPLDEFAASILPSIRRTAVLCAPFSAPNSSLSTSVSGIAPQFTSTKGCLARGELSCSARANADLPVPLSPVKSTGSGTFLATVRSRKTSTSARLRPAIRPTSRRARRAPV